MIHHKLYFRKSYKNSSGEHPIYLRINQKKKVSDITLNIFATEKCWNDEKLRVSKRDPNHYIINKKLSRAEAKAVRILDKYDREERYLSIDEFKRNFKDGHFGSKSFFDYAQKVIDEKEGKLEPGTMKGMKDQVNKLKTFQDDIQINEIDLSFINAYEKFLRTVRNNNDNTVIKSMKFLKQIVLHAFNNGELNRNPFVHYPIGRIEGKREHLTLTEVEKLQDMYRNGDLKWNKQNVLRYFLFSCYTGLSFADVSDLRKRDITEKEIDGKQIRMIDTTRKKTGTDVLVPLLTEAENLLPGNTYYDVQKIFKVFTNQPTNRYLKELMEMAGITKRITTHCARHTFATLCKSKGIEYDVIAKFLGHKDQKTTKIYAKYEMELLVSEMGKWNTITEP